MTEISFDRIYKLPRDKRYFNVSVLWIFYYPLLVRLLYMVRTPHELVTFLSLAFGVGGGIFLLGSGYKSLLLAALCMHLKDLFDASDGSLARLQDKTNRIARFMDSLADSIVMTWLVTAIALKYYPEAGPGIAGEAITAWLSIFLQCSYFNYYLVAYTRLVGETNVRLDERRTDEDRLLYPSGGKRMVLAALQRSYALIYGWQDRLMAAVDRWGLKAVCGKAPDELDERERGAWYGDKHLLTLNSPLCFGTHLFVLILCSLLAHPRLFYYIVIFAMNPYLFLNMSARQLAQRNVFSSLAGPGGNRG